FLQRDVPCLVGEGAALRRRAVVQFYFELVEAETVARVGDRESDTGAEGQQGGEANVPGYSHDGRGHDPVPLVLRGAVAGIVARGEVVEAEEVAAIGGRVAVRVGKRGPPLRRRRVRLVDLEEKRVVPGALGRGGKKHVPEV